MGAGMSHSGNLEKSMELIGCTIEKIFMLSPRNSKSYNVIDGAWTTEPSTTTHTQTMYQAFGIFAA